MELDQRMVNELVNEAALRAVTDGMPASIARQLDDQNPVIPLAVDIDGDLATAALLSWSEQDSGWEPSLCDVILIKQDGLWCYDGGSSGLPPRHYPLTARRPAEPPGVYIRLYAVVSGGSSVRGGAGTWLAAGLHVAAEVDALRIGDRHVAVPFHGYVPMVVPNGAPAEVTAISSDGAILETLGLRRSELFRDLGRRIPNDWPFKVS